MFHAVLLESSSSMHLSFFVLPLEPRRFFPVRRLVWFHVRLVGSRFCVRFTLPLSLLGLPAAWPCATPAFGTDFFFPGCPVCPLLPLFFFLSMLTPIFRRRALIGLGEWADPHSSCDSFYGDVKSACHCLEWSTFLGLVGRPFVCDFFCDW